VRVRRDRGDRPAAETVRTVQVNGTFGTGQGTAVTYDTALVPVGARGPVSSVSANGGTTVTLTARGLQPGRT
jgi:hypothetical protein